MLRSVRCVGVIAISLLALIAAGCGMSSAKPKAESAMAAFHSQLNAGDLDSIWNTADEAFRSSVKRDKYDKFIGAVHRKLGNVVKTTTVNWSVNSRNFKTSVVLVQDTEFEHGAGSETFTYNVSGDDVKLAGYNIQSSDLVTL